MDNTPQMSSLKSAFFLLLSPLLLFGGQHFSVAAVSKPVAPIEKTTDTAAALAQAVYDRPQGSDSSARVLMLLENEGQETKKRELYIYAVDKGNSERWTLMRFVQPEDVDGTGLLSMDYKGDKSDQWLYLPALDRVRRISSKRKGGRFVGSDFYYEDLADREVNMDHHRIIGSDKVGGLPCILLESTPVDSSNSVYSKRESCIHEKLLLPLRIDFYQRSNEPVKRLQARKIKKLQGYWTVFDSTMQNLKTGQQTKLITTEIAYDLGIPDSLFSQRGLSDDHQEQAFRPDRAK